VRAPVERYSDVILRFASDAKPQRSPLTARRPRRCPFPRRMSEATSLQRRLSCGVETDLEGFIRPSYNATGGASKAMRRGNCHHWDTNETLALTRPYERAGMRRGAGIPKTSSARVCSTLRSCGRARPLFIDLGIQRQTS
jgi:hypothetical protein